MIRKLLLPLTGTAAGEAALETALLTAGLFRAHLVALHVMLDARDIAPLTNEGMSGMMIEKMMAETERDSGARAAAIHAMFDRVTAARGMPVGAASAETATARYQAITGREDDLVAQQARLADLTVIPHPAGGDEVSSSDALHAVLFDSGHPVLIAPKLAPACIGTRIAIGWNGTGESASAVQSVLPWLARATAVRILTSDEYQRRGPPATELAAYLGLHGVRPDIASFRSIDKDVGAGLLAAAAEFGADLVAMGAYSNSRLRQLILGGVTRHVLEHARVPLLMNR